LGIRDVNQWDETGDCEAGPGGTSRSWNLRYERADLRGPRASIRRNRRIEGARAVDGATTWRSLRPPVAVGSSPSRPSRTLRRAREQWLPTIPCHRVLLVRTALVCSGERGAGTALRHHLRHVTCIRNHLGSLCRPASARQLPPRPITRLRHRPRVPARANSRHVPSSWFRTTSTACSAHRTGSSPARVRLRVGQGRRCIATCYRLGFGAFRRRVTHHATLPSRAECTSPRPRDAFIPPEDSLASSRTVSPRPLPP